MTYYRLVGIIVPESRLALLRQALAAESIGVARLASIVPPFFRPGYESYSNGWTASVSNPRKLHAFAEISWSISRSARRSRSSSANLEPMP